MTLPNNRGRQEPLRFKKLKLNVDQCTSLELQIIEVLNFYHSKLNSINI